MRPDARACVAPGAGSGIDARRVSKLSRARRRADVAGWPRRIRQSRRSSEPEEGAAGIIDFRARRRRRGALHLPCRCVDLHVRQSSRSAAGAPHIRPADGGSERLRCRPRTIGAGWAHNAHLSHATLGERRDLALAERVQARHHASPACDTCALTGDVSSGATLVDQWRERRRCEGYGVLGAGGTAKTAAVACIGIEAARALVHDPGALRAGGDAGRARGRRAHRVHASLAIDVGALNRASGGRTAANYHDGATPGRYGTSAPSTLRSLPAT